MSEAKKLGRPRKEGTKKQIPVRVHSDEEYSMMLDVPPRMRVIAILAWREANMAYLFSDEDSGGSQ